MIPIRGAGKYILVPGVRKKFGRGTYFVPEGEKHFREKETKITLKGDVEGEITKCGKQTYYMREGEGKK